MKSSLLVLGHTLGSPSPYLGRNAPEKQFELRKALYTIDPTHQPLLAPDCSIPQVASCGSWPTTTRCHTAKFQHLADIFQLTERHLSPSLTPVAHKGCTSGLHILSSSVYGSLPSPGLFPRRPSVLTSNLSVPRPGVRLRLRPPLRQALGFQGRVDADRG